MTRASALGRPRVLRGAAAARWPHMSTKPTALYIVMAYIVMAYIVMTYIVMAYIVMAYTVMAYIVLAYKATKPTALSRHRRRHVCGRHAVGDAEIEP